MIYCLNYIYIFFFLTLSLQLLPEADWSRHRRQEQLSPMPSVEVASLIKIIHTRLQIVKVKHHSFTNRISDLRY